MLACRPDGGAGTSVPGEGLGKASDPSLDARAGEDAEAGEVVEDYPDRETPYDQYVAKAHMRMALRVHNPAKLADHWTAFSRAYGLGTLDLETLIREGLYAAGVPSEVLDVLDASSSWGVELDYPLRSFVGASWAYLPSKPEQSLALALALADWLKMEEQSEGLWHMDDSLAGFEEELEGGLAAELEVDESIPVDQRSEGSYLGLQAEGVVLAFRAAAATRSLVLRPDPLSRLMFVELEGFESALPDLLEDFDQTTHSESREEWAHNFRALDRLYFSIDQWSSDKKDGGQHLALELGAEGRLDHLDYGQLGGVLGPARSKPSRLARLLPGRALAAVTMSWGDPSGVAELLRAGTIGPGSSPIEREFGDWSDELLDQVVEDVGLAVYVNDRGEHAFLIAMPGLDARGMADSAKLLMKLAERTLLSHEASLTAREASGELSPEIVAKRRMPYSTITFRVPGQGKVQGLRVAVTDEVIESANLIADEKGRISMAAFEHKGVFMFVVGPGLESFASSLGKSSLADMAGLKAAHAQYGGCQVCGVVNTKRSATSLYGRHKRGMTKEKRREVKALLPKVRGGGHSSLAFRMEAARIRLFYAMDMSLGRAKDGADPAWENFMRALGARGETLSDPREWLFGLR